MKVYTSKILDLCIGDDDAVTYMEAKVDNDDTVQLTFPGRVDKENETIVKTRWLTRNDLLALRSLINTALRHVE
jgi:hypothetical protein